MRSLIFGIALLCAAHAQAAPYLDIHEIETPKGLHVWFVQDKHVPVVAWKFSVGGGSQFDAPGREGSAELLSSLFDEGAGKRDAETFQTALENDAIRMGFSATRDRFYGNLKTTVAHRAMAEELFDDALNRPHFDPSAITRMKQALQSNLRFQLMDPDQIASRKLFAELYGTQPYARPVEGTMASLDAITRQDLLTEKSALFCRDRLNIAVVGAMDEQQIAETADRFFGSWGKCPTALPDTAQMAKLDGRTIFVPWAGAQSSVLMVQGGLARRDKDWWAARILDFALGAGELSSRLMEEVRVKRGLTYGVSSTLMPLDHSPLWIVQAGIDPAGTEEAIAVMKKTWTDVAEHGLTDEEIAAAKDYLIGSMPLALTSTDMIADILLQLQQDGLPKTTLDTRAAEISAVTPEDIRRVAKQYLKPGTLTTVIVGPDRKDKK